MLPRLIAKYYFHNRRRTYRAVAILAIGLSLVLSTDMLLSGYLQQIEEFASLVDDESNHVLIRNSDTKEIFNQKQLREINKTLESHLGIQFSIYMRQISVSLQSIDTNIPSAELIVANLSKLRDNDWIFTDNNASDIYVSSTFDGFNRSVDSFSIDNGSSFDIERYDALKSLHPDVLVDWNSNYSLSQGMNFIFLRVKADFTEDLVESLEVIDGLSIISNLPASQFLRVSADQITNILLLLQLGMSILLIFSITYVMVILVQESEDDIKIMNNIGLERWKIFTIFMGQALLSALFAMIVAFAFSVTFLHSILPFITLFNLPYGTIVIHSDIVIITAIQSLVVTIISGAYPSLKGAGFID